MSHSRARQLQKLYSKASRTVLSSDGPSMASGPYCTALLSAPIRSHETKPITPVESRATLIHQRVQDIRTRSIPNNPICLKCGSTGHVIQQCHNAQLCFVCNNFGHKGKFCTVYRHPVTKRRENPPPNPRYSAHTISQSHRDPPPPSLSRLAPGALPRLRVAKLPDRSDRALSTPMAYLAPITQLIATPRSLAVEAALRQSFVLDDIAA